MATMIVKHTVADFDAWKNVFDEMDSKRVSHGWISYDLLRDSTNPNAVVIVNRVGSIEVGKDADLAIWNAHPFSVYARVDSTFIDGEVYFDREQDISRRADLAKERATLEAAEPNRPPAQGQSPQTPRRRPRTGFDEEGDQPR